MAAYFNTILFSSLLLLASLAAAAAQTSFRPKALILNVTKDASSTTPQYIVQIKQRTPLVPVKLTLDLGGQFLWVDCDQSYSSSTYRPARCNSAQCSLAKSTACGTCNSAPRPGCSNNTCGLFPDNTITNTATSGDLGSDVVALQSTDGSNPGRIVSVPDLSFVCAPTFLLDGLARGVTGMAGLGRTRISLPSQFSSSFSFTRKFAICLAGSPDFPGVVFFGDARPYIFQQNHDVTPRTFTPLIINPVSTAGVSNAGEPSTEYFIGVKSIKISEKAVPINTSLLTIDNKGNGGTKISTLIPYTTLETSIHKAVVNAFVDGMTQLQLPRVAPVAPFSACFNSTFAVPTPLGARVPEFDIVLQGENAVWSLIARNSMVDVSDDVFCLAFVDGGVNPRTSIVIGGYQLEDSLLEFDLAASKLGITSGLSGFRTTCSDFNFTSIA